MFTHHDRQHTEGALGSLLEPGSGVGSCIWGQSFTYDPFGNISKTVLSGSAGTSFLPTYQASPSITNRIASLPGGVTPTYDANGNSLNDSFHQFTWDAENRPVSVNGTAVTLTYDAIGRMVEQARGTSYTQIVYSPLGSKLAKMNGATLQTGYVPLTSGASAVYTSSGLAYYRHPDHLGSSRLASTPTQTLYSDTAYSAFGEPYAQSGTADPSFTAQDQDTTSGVYDFLYRKYDPGQSRWISPDASGLAAVNSAFPQSWNCYVYVLNDPLRLFDSTGLTCQTVYVTDESGDALTDDNGDYITYQEDNGDGLGCNSRTGSGGGSTFAGGAPGGFSSCTTIAGVSQGCGNTNFDGSDPGDDGDDSNNGSTISNPNNPQLTTAITFNLIIPLFGWGLGPAITVSYVPSKKLLCGGGGVGAALGHNVSMGPVLVNGDPKNVLSGASLSGGYNLTILRGTQGSWNSSGTTSGYSMGLPGASAAVTGSGCKQF